MKLCKRCGEIKEAKDFSPYKKSKDGLFSWCKKCNCELQKGRYSRLTSEERKSLNRHNRGFVSAEKSHNKQTERYRNDPEFRLKIRLGNNSKRYGVTPEEYARLRAQPCGICGDYREEPGRRGCGMHIDHNHRTGVVRGTLCGKCNRGIGLFDDSPEKLEAAAKYLRGKAEAGKE